MRHGSAAWKGVVFESHEDAKRGRWIHPLAAPQQARALHSKTPCARVRAGTVALIVAPRFGTKDAFMSIRWTFLLFSAVAAQGVLGAAKEAADRPIARWHAVGGQALREQAAVPQLKAALSHPDAAGVGGRVATNMARFVVQRMAGAEDAARASRLVPLVEAILDHESLGEVTRHGWHVAVRVPPAVAARMAEAAASLRVAGAPPTLSTNGWFLAASDAPGLARAWKETGRPVAGFVSAELDLPRVLGTGHDAWPFLKASLFPSNGVVRTAASLSFAAPPLAEPGPWKIPDGAIRDPIIRFQAIRGAAPLVEKVGWMATLAGGAAPSQLFGWAQPKNVFRNWVAFPVEKPAARLAKVESDIRPLFAESAGGPRYEGRLVMATNNSALAVLGLKACQPALLPYQQDGQQYLIASLTPPMVSTNPLPAELVAQVHRPALVAYEWEIAGESFLHWNVAFDFNKMAQRLAPFPARALARRWFMNIAPDLGNAVSEVLRVSPTEYTFLRKSDIGLDGLEMTLLSRWIDAPHGLHARPGALPPLPK